MKWSFVLVDRTHLIFFLPIGLLYPVISPETTEACNDSITETTAGLGVCVRVWVYACMYLFWGWGHNHTHTYTVIKFEYGKK